MRGVLIDRGRTLNSSNEKTRTMAGLLPNGYPAGLRYYASAFVMCESDSYACNVSRGTYSA